MAGAKLNKEVEVSSKSFFEAVTDYLHYPDFVEGCSGAEIVNETATKKSVRYRVNLVKELTYVLEHEQDPAGKWMRWKLVESDFLTKNSGLWKIQEVGPNLCKVDYEVDIEFKFPIPGFVLKKLIQSNLPKMVNNFTQHAGKFGKDITH